MIMPNVKSTSCAGAVVVALSAAAAVVVALSAAAAVVVALSPAAAVVVVSSLELEHAAATIASTATSTSKRMERLLLVICFSSVHCILTDADVTPRTRLY